jgi:hypothetical protein
MSLTGDIYASDHAKKINFGLDADAHVRLLGLAFAGRVQPFHISHPAVCQSSKELNDARNLTWLGAPAWNRWRRVYGLVGVGVLGPGHRLYDEALQNATLRDRRFDPIREPLRALIAARQTHRSLEDPSIIADVANHLFLARPSETSPTVTAWQDIERQLRMINGNLLTAHDNDFRNIHSIIMVAGTKRKAPVIRHVLTSGHFQLRYLITDTTAAEALLT